MRKMSRSEREIYDMASAITDAIPDGSELGLVISALTLIMEASLAKVPPLQRAMALEVVSRRFADTSAYVADAIIEGKSS